MGTRKDIYLNEYGASYKEINVDDMYRNALLEAIDILRIRYGWTEDEIQSHLGLSDQDYKQFAEHPVPGQLQLDIKD
jgi:hypothetical protein